MAESKQEEQAPSYKKQMERIAEIFKILMVEKILTCFYDKDLSSIDLISQRLCLEGSRRQANSALHALKTKDAGQQSVSVVYKSHVDISEEEKTHFPSVLQSMEPRAKEIGEFTAPEAAYIDELIKGIFHLIVGTKRGLKDTSGPSVGRRVVILETPAKNRSCVVMLDLECEDLVNEIFSTFFPVASTIDLISQRLCLEGSRRQANSALHAIKTSDAGLQSVSVAYKSHVDISEEEKTHFPSVLQSMEPRAKEIGEFTAPEAAYIDELIKAIFHLIVGTKRGLKDTSGPSVGRRIVILETPAKNRSCVLKLDLECEDLVNENFSIFFPVARLQEEMQKYLALKQMHQDGDAPEVQKKILYCFRIVSRLFADPVKAEEGFQFPDQLKDINIWKILTNLVDPNTGSPQARILRENAPEEGVDDSLLQLMVSSAAALGGAAAAVDMDAGLAEDADADLGGDEGVVIDNDDDGSEADDEVEGDLGDDNNDDDGGGHVEIRRITYDLNVAISHVDPLGQPNAGALHQLVLTELSLHPLPGIDVPDGGYGVTYVLQAGNEQQRVDLQGLQNVQNPPWINLAGFIVSVEARDLFLPKFIPVSMDTPHGDAQPMGTFDIRGCEDAIDLMLDVAVLVNPIVVGYNTDYWVNLPNYPDSILNHDDIVEAYWPLVVQGLFRVVVVLPVNDDHDDPPSGESVVED